MASQESDVVNFDDEKLGGKVLLKMHQHPFLVIGLGGLLATVAVGAYRFKTRSKDFPMSLYFIQLRVAAQSAVIGSLTVGIAYNMLNEYVFKAKQKS